MCDCPFVICFSGGDMSWLISMDNVLWTWSLGFVCVNRVQTPRASPISQLKISHWHFIFWRGNLAKTYSIHLSFKNSSQIRLYLIYNSTTTKRIPEGILDLNTIPWVEMVTIYYEFVTDCLHLKNCFGNLAFAYALGVSLLKFPYCFGNDVCFFVFFIDK